MRRYGQALAETFPRAERIIGPPWLNIVAQLFHVVPHRLPPAMDDPRAISHFVRDASLKRPLLLSVEYLQWADTVGIDLLRLLADEIAQDLPVLLLITLDTPAPVERLTASQHTEPTRLVETLVRQGVARALHLGPVSAEDVSRSLAVTSEVAERLVYLAEGDPWIIYSLWEEWKRQGAIVEQADGTWGINYEQDGAWWVYGDLRDQVFNLLADLLDTNPPPPLGIQEAITILNCAATEGEIFTAQAVAEALEMDPDDLMDFLDEYLCVPADEDGTSGEGILCEVGFLSLPRGPVFQYRFARPYLHHVFAKYPKREDDRRQWSGRLAEALERFHYPLTAFIADTLYRLFDAAGMPERAEPYRRISLQTPSPETLRWHVRFLQQTVSEDDVFGVYRLLDVGLQLCGLIAEERPDLWPEGYELACDLLRRAESLGDRLWEAHACYYAAWHLKDGGHPREALPLIGRALEIYQKRSLNVAAGLNLLGLVLRALGNLAGARECLERALRIFWATLPPDHPHIRIVEGNLRALEGAGGRSPSELRS